MEQKNKEKISQLIKTLFEKMGFQTNIEIIDQAEGVLFNIKTAESDFFFNENERRNYIISLNHIIKKISQQILDKESQPKFFLDINSYQKQRNDTLKELARLSAQKVRYFQKEISLKPMSSYERRIIHLALAGDPDIVTESAGQGPDRKVVIKPNLMNASLSKK